MTAKGTREECEARAAAILGRAVSDIAWTFAEGGKAAIAAQEVEPGHDREAAAAKYAARDVRARRERQERPNVSSSDASGK
jgi:hypothetical protein